MPRTKGAVNKPKSKEHHLEALRKLGVDVPLKNGNPKKEKFKVDNPEIPNEETVDLNKQLLRCGNPACGKILEEQYRKCPFCGVNLEWL